MGKGNAKQLSEQRLQALDDIRKRSVLDRTYIVMNILATIIACYGLFENSPAVVIGAMLIALLFGPLVAMALGVVEGDNRQLVRALVTEFAGVVVVYLSALIVGLLNREIPISNEIIARTAPNFLDLMIALVGGAAGAFALISPRIGLSVVGVAVAIALVPPLSSSAILLGRGEFGLAGGALLLAFTNMVAIEFAASVVLIVMRHDVRLVMKLSPKRLLSHYTLSVVMLLALGVVHSFVVQAEVYSSHDFTSKEIADIQASLPAAPSGKPIDFRLREVQIKTLTDRGQVP